MCIGYCYGFSLDTCGKSGDSGKASGELDGKTTPLIWGKVIIQIGGVLFLTKLFMVEKLGVLEYSILMTIYDLRGL